MIRSLSNIQRNKGTLKTDSIDDVEQHHNQEIKEILSNKGIIGYSNRSKLGNQHTEAGLYLLNRLKRNPETRAERYWWYLRLNQEILDDELLAIFKTLSGALKSINNSPSNPTKNIKVYIYINSQAAIQRLQKIRDLGPGRDIVQKCTTLAQRLRNKGVKITI
jgi:hypothetical protein